MANEVTINVKARDRGATAGLNQVKNNFSRILSGLKGMAVVTGGLLANSLVAPTGVALAGLAVDLGGAGAAVGAFGLAVAPQIKRITDLKANLATMPPATREAAVAFRGMRKDLNDWSDSLTPTTMPLFTRGLNLIRGIIPKLTPLVKTAASAFDGMLDGIERGVRGGGLDRFLDQVNKTAQTALPSLLRSVGNVGKGLGHLFMAFAPLTSGSMIGGVEKLTARFADWAKSMRGNPEFERFVRQMQANLPTIFALLGNLLLVVGRISAALLPFSGLTLKVAAAFAALLAAIPQGVMDWLAPAIAGIVLAVKAWAVAQGVLNIVLAANPIGLVVIAIAALVAGLIYAYRHSETFRNIVKTAFDAVKDAVTGLKEKAGPAVEAIAQFFTDTLPRAFDEGVAKLIDIVGKVDEAVAKVKESLSGLSEGSAAGPGGKGKKKGSIWDWIAPEITQPEKFIGPIKTAVSRATGFVKGFAKKWSAKLGIDGLGSVRSIAGRARQSAYDFARRMYRALLRANFPGSSVVKAAARACVAFARGAYRATLRALDRASSVARTIMARLRSIVHTITIPVRMLMPRMPKMPWQRLGGVSRLGGIARKQAGGNTTLVGEEGPELVDMPPGAYVRPEATTRARMMGAQAAAGGPMVINLVVDAKVLASLLFDPLKNEVRQRGGKGGGSAQKAWGYA